MNGWVGGFDGAIEGVVEGDSVGDGVTPGTFVGVIAALVVAAALVVVEGPVDDVVDIDAQFIQFEPEQYSHSQTKKPRANMSSLHAELVYTELAKSAPGGTMKFPSAVQLRKADALMTTVDTSTPRNTAVCSLKAL